MIAKIYMLTILYSSDVALGVQWVFTNCNNGGQVEGRFRDHVDWGINIC